MQSSRDFNFFVIYVIFPSNPNSKIMRIYKKILLIATLPPYPKEVDNFPLFFGNPSLIQRCIFCHCCWRHELFEPLISISVSTSIFIHLCSLASLYFALCPEYCLLCTVHCALNNVHCTLCPRDCVLYAVHCALETVYCTLYTLQRERDRPIHQEMPGQCHCQTEKDGRTLKASIVDCTVEKSVQIHHLLTV